MTITLHEHLQEDGRATGRTVEVPAVDGSPTDAGLAAAARHLGVMVGPSGSALVGEVERKGERKLTTWRTR